jgi:ABC-type bacteriocin/lantibiotic exporter with double-glycine peptidase domain
MKIALLLFVVIVASILVAKTNSSDNPILSQENVVLQTSHTDCGVAAAKNVLVAFNKNPTAVDTLLKLSDNGVTLLDLKTALSKQGLHCIGYKTTLRDLAQLPLPAIAHINDNHFVVIETIGEKDLTVINPSVGRLRYRASAFEEKWDGIALCVSEN